VYKNQWLKRLAMAQIPQGSNSNMGAISSSVENRGLSSSGDDPRSRFAQAQLAQKIDEKIALGMNPKVALREAKEEVNRLMGYSS
jgi:hypothetical protein